MSDMFDISTFEVLSFDCFGAMIDWETGIHSAISPILEAHGVKISRDEILESYGNIEAKLEQGSYLPYREILQRAMTDIGAKFSIKLNSFETDSLLDSFAEWPPFSDTVESLRKLKSKYTLAIISNVDNELFKLTSRKLEIKFDWITTAEEVGSYKPSLENFHYALRQFKVSKKHLLHVAQSLYHDIAPANHLGLTTVWVNRRKNKIGSGAPPPMVAKPSREVTDLSELAALLGVT